MVNKSTGVSVALVIVLIAGTFSITSWMGKVDQRLASMEKAFEDQWTGGDMEHWVSLLEALNGDALTVPSVPVSDG